MTALYGEEIYKSLQGRSPYKFHLDREVLKNDGGKAGQHCELNLVLFVPGKDISIFNVCLCSCCISEDLEFWLNIFSNDVPTPWSTYWFPHSLFIEIKGTICCIHIRWYCVGFFYQLLRHNIIIKLGHHFIDDGPCQQSLFRAVFWHPSIH